MTIKDLIYSIAAGKAQDAQVAFESTLADKITTAISAQRDALAASMFKKTPAVAEQTELEEHVSHDDVNHEADVHADSKINWGQHPGHAARHQAIEDRIVEKHGAKALKHIQKHTESQEKFVDAHFHPGTDREREVSEHEFHTEHKPHMDKHLTAAQDASMEHQKNRAPRRLTRSIARTRGLREQVETPTQE